EEVSEIAKIANKYKIHIVPRGGGADLVGGSTTQNGILLDITRMNRILEIDEVNMFCIVEPGITWAILHSELQKKGLTTGVIGPGSGYSATIGGGISNATVGFGSTKYGVVPDICLGVEVVLSNPRGTIIRTGAAVSKYSKPFCRYGTAPDFTGLFMGDVGTMGIKTKAYLKLFPITPYKTRRDYMLLSKDFKDMTKIFHKLQQKVLDGILNLTAIPDNIIALRQGMATERPPKKIEITGPVFGVELEAYDERIFDVYIDQVDEIMKNNNARPFEFQEVDLSQPLTKDYRFNLKYAFNYFHAGISMQPPLIACTTCHKIPITDISKAAKVHEEFYSRYKNEFPVGGGVLGAILAGVIFALPNGNCVIVGGLAAENVDGQRQAAMNIWHKKIRSQVRYGGIHYWLGESISQSIVEANAYKPDFVQFFKDIKRAVDPNFLLSPNKFHFYNYEDDYTKYIVKDE
ncbi:MAG: FAD-binding oxidoreductase, partial [Candidatus Hodarchaeota archaeon]